MPFTVVVEDPDNGARFVVGRAVSELGLLVEACELPLGKIVELRFQCDDGLEEIVARAEVVSSTQLHFRAFVNQDADPAVRVH